MLMCTVTWRMRYKCVGLSRLDAPEASVDEGLRDDGSCFFVSDPQGVRR